MADKPRVINRNDIPERVRREAGKIRDGWVYEIVGDYGPSDAVPPTAIKGAWRIDEHGRVTGEYMANPNFASGTRTES